MRQRTASALGWLVAVSVLLPGAAMAAPRPQRIMSMMQCNDLLLLAMVPRQRITSVTALAHPAVAALMPGADRGVAINHGTAEDIVRDRPDLILAGPYSVSVARRLAKRVGANVVEIGPVESFADIRRTTRRIGALVSESARAETMIARMDAVLRQLAAARPARIVRVAAWSGDGTAAGRAPLFEEVIRLAGGINVAAPPRNSASASFGPEELLAARPDAILIGRDSWSAPSLNQVLARHPLVRRLYRGRTITYPMPPLTCGLPQAAETARDLRRAFAALPAGRIAW